MRYQVLSNLQHDGRDYAPGTVVEISDDVQAQALLAVGVIAPAEKPADPPPPPPPPPPPDKAPAKGRAKAK